MELKINKNIFNDTFYPLLLDNEHFIILLLGGGSSGKSYFSFQRCIVRCLQDKRKYLIVRNSATDLARSCWEDVLNALDFFCIKQYVEINKTTKQILFPNGSQILFMGLDSDEKVKSIPNITDIIVEECSEITLDKFSQLKQRLRGSGALKNQIVLQCNPVSKVNWIYKHFFENGCKEENCIIHRSTYKDNKFVNETTRQALEGYKQTNELFYRIYCLGEFGSLSKLVYNNWHIAEFNHAAIKNGALLVGLDFGFVNDTTALICSLLVESEKRIYIFDEMGNTGLVNSDISQIIIGKGLAKSTIIADSAEMKSIEEIKRAGVPRIKACTKGAGSITQGIQKLQQYEIIVHPSCYKTIEELKNYSWKKDKSTNEYINEAEDKNNHFMDALRYSLQCVEVNTKLKTLSKKQLSI